MKKKYYFEDEYSNICYTEAYFLDKIKDEGLNEMEVYEALGDNVPGVAWCQHEAFFIDDSALTCGKQCGIYSPRNGKSGCCKHYTTKTYTKGRKIKLRLDEKY